MTKKQANLIMATIVALILTQILCTALLLRGLERSRRAFEGTEASCMDMKAANTAPAVSMAIPAEPEEEAKEAPTCPAAPTTVETHSVLKIEIAPPAPAVTSGDTAATEDK